MRWRTSAPTLLAAVALSLMTTQGASAAPLARAAAKPLGNAPICVSVWHNVGNITKTGYARNGCGQALNLKIVWAHGADGPCRTVAPGITISHKIPRGPRTFDGANKC